MKKKKLNYEKLEIEIFKLPKEEIITTSNVDDNVDEDGWI